MENKNKTLEMGDSMLYLSPYNFISFWSFGLNLSLTYWNLVVTDCQYKFSI